MQAFVQNNGPYDRVEQDYDKNVAQITPYPAVSKKTYKDLYAQKQDRYQTEYQTSQTKSPLTHTFREQYYTTNDIAFPSIKV